MARFVSPTRTTVPGRSVMSISPPGRNAISQGITRLSLTVSNESSPALGMGLPEPSAGQPARSTGTMPRAAKRSKRPVFYVYCSWLSSRCSCNEFFSYNIGTVSRHVNIAGERCRPAARIRVRRPGRGCFRRLLSTAPANSGRMKTCPGPPASAFLSPGSDRSCCRRAGLSSRR